MSDKIDTNTFYAEYHGHKTSHLDILLCQMKNMNKKIIYFAGDSSLDNKYWIFDLPFEDAVNGYQHILKPPKMKPDVAYHFNKLLEISEYNDYCVVNTSIEESTLGNRKDDLMPQDKIIRQNITNDDILIVCVGGNDIALKPSTTTITNLSSLILTDNETLIKSDYDNSSSMKYFINMFKINIKNYIKKLITDKHPKIIVCMFYYPDEKITECWADRILSLIDYNKKPDKLKYIVRQIFKYGISEIKIPNHDIIPFPMFKVLDGKNTNDYIQRVEPSSIGGFKIALALKKCIFENVMP